MINNRQLHLENCLKVQGEHRFTHSLLEGVVGTQNQRSPVIVRVTIVYTYKDVPFQILFLCYTLELYGIITIGDRVIYRNTTIFAMFPVYENLMLP